METEDRWGEGDGEELEAEILRADHAFGAELHGTTPEEELEGEGLDTALARERPERGSVDEVFELADDGNPDVEGELIADGFRVSDAYASPEEAALSVRDEAPGATDHDDPHPADGD